MQKEQLSALMDGETLDNEVLSALSKDATLQKSWESYHLIRDTLRDDLGEVVHWDLAARVAAALEKETGHQAVSDLIPEAQPEPALWAKMPFWRKIRPWTGQMVQLGIAASVSLAVIVGVQQYNQSADNVDRAETPVFNTLPMMGKASPVSLGVPSDSFDTSGVNQRVQEQHQRVNAMLQDYELQRRLHAEPMELDQQAPQQVQNQVSDNQRLSTQSH